MFFKKKKIEIYAPVSGELINIEKVNDPVFANKMFGDGFAIIPAGEGKVTFYSPINGVLTTAMDSGHAYGITEKSTKIEVLLHIGMDTVELQGKGFEVKVTKDQILHANDKLVEVDLDFLKKEKKDTATPIVFTKETMDQYNYKVVILKQGPVKQGEIVAELVKK